MECVRVTMWSPGYQYPAFDAWVQNKKQFWGLAYDYITKNLKGIDERTAKILAEAFSVDVDRINEAGEAGGCTRIFEVYIDDDYVDEVVVQGPVHEVVKALKVIADELRAVYEEGGSTFELAHDDTFKRTIRDILDLRAEAEYADEDTYFYVAGDSHATVEKRMNEFLNPA